MTEERKHAILLAATLLSAREILDSMDSMLAGFGGSLYFGTTSRDPFSTD